MGGQEIIAVFFFFALIIKFLHDININMEKLMGSREWRQRGEEHQRFGAGFIFTVITEMNNTGGYRRKQLCWYSDFKCPQGE